MAEPLAALLAAALVLAPVPGLSAAPAARPAATERTELPPGPGPASPVASPVLEGPEPAPTPATTVGGRCHGSRPCKRLVVLAAVSGGVGLTTMIVGGVLAARPRRFDPDDPTRPIAERPAGSAALAIGLGLLATGLLMTLAAVRASRHAKSTGLSTRLRLPARLPAF